VGFDDAGGGGGGERPMTNEPLDVFKFGDCSKERAQVLAPRRPEFV
jgi:hypothetical protein